MPTKESPNSSEVISLSSLEDRFTPFGELSDSIQAQLNQYSYEELFDDSSLRQSLELPKDSQLLGVGTMSIAIRYKDSVLRFPKTDDQTAREELVKHRLNTIPWGERAMKGVEKITAVDKEKGIVVTTYIDGIPATNGTASDLLRVGYEDIASACSIINRMHQNGYCLDSEPANIILRREAPNGQRLAFIDPLSKEDWPQRTARSDLSILMHALTNMVRHPINNPNVEAMIQERLALFDEIAEANF